MNQVRSLLPALCGTALLTLTTTVFAAGEPVTELSDKEKLRHETTGIAGGAVIGGLIGGPLGAVLTAGFGGWVSDLTISKKENALLAESLEAQQRELVAMQAEYRALQARYQVASRESQAARVRNASVEVQSPRNTAQANCCSDSELALHFKTGSADIEILYDAKLTEFANLVKTLPDAVIDITGHADRRGADSANLALSQRRIQAVEARLRSLGVRNKSLQTSAYGETRPASSVDNFENNFFDRRVVVKIVAPGNGMLTRAND